MVDDRCHVFVESGCLGMQPYLGGRSHPKLNMSGRPIAKKYCEGKVKRTLKRRSKVLEIVKREAYGISDCMLSIQPVRRQSMPMKQRALLLDSSDVDWRWWVHFDCIRVNIG